MASTTITITITIIESPTACEQCRLAEDVAARLSEKYPGQITIKILSILDPEADRYGVVLTPTVVVNDFIVSTRRAPTLEKMEMLIRKIAEIDNRQ